MERTEVVTKHEVCLTAGSVLQWIGFATTGMLCTMDAARMLRGLSEKQGWQWGPAIYCSLYAIPALWAIGGRPTPTLTPAVTSTGAYK